MTDGTIDGFDELHYGDEIEYVGPEELDDVIVAEPVDQEAHEILQVSPDTSDAIVKAAFQSKVKQEHPDQGGKGDVGRLKRAKEELLEKS